MLVTLSLFVCRLLVLLVFNEEIFKLIKNRSPYNNKKINHINNSTCPFSAEIISSKRLGDMKSSKTIFVICCTNFMLMIMLNLTKRKEEKRKKTVRSIKSSRLFWLNNFLQVFFATLYG